MSDEKWGVQTLMILGYCANTAVFGKRRFSKVTYCSIQIPKQNSQEVKETEKRE